MTKKPLESRKAKILKPPYSVHHRIPQSRAKEGFEINKSDNLMPMNKKVHENLHAFFLNMTPQEQLEFWHTINRATLSDKIMRRLDKVINTVPEEFYNKILLR